MGLADGLLQATDDAVLVVEALAVGGAQSLHLPAVVEPVPLELQPVLAHLLLQLLEVGVLLQEAHQMGHDRHQGRLCQLGGGGKTMFNKYTFLGFGVQPDFLQVLLIHV